jgi:hypothetical protein
MPQHVHHACLLGRVQHFLRFPRIQGERLFAKNVLTGFQPRNGYVLVKIGGRGDVDNIQILSFDHLFPISGVLLPAEFFSRLFYQVLRPPAYDLFHRLDAVPEKEGSRFQAEAMGLAHKSIADHAYAELFHINPP